MSVYTEKLEQAAHLVGHCGYDVWLTFVRETSGHTDPVLPLILQGGLTWQSALMVFASGRKIAVVGNYDSDAVIASGDWDEVVPYVQGIGDVLRSVLDREVASSAPRVALNYSLDDDKGDGLTHGMFLLLSSILKGTRFVEGLVSAADLLSQLRGIKSSTEIARIRAAIAEGDLLFSEVPEFVRIGMSERTLYDHIQRRMRERNLGFAWDEVGDPIVNFGPNSMIGHGIPSETVFLAEGQVLHIDLGVIKDGYSSDIQRCWYVGPDVPEDVKLALGAVNRAISAGAAKVRPGAQGVEADSAARRSLMADGFPEYRHALGHQVGRMAHDGGGSILGPAWERYGATPFRPIREGQVYTVELGVTLPERGYIGIEEIVLVTREGVEWMSDRQLTMPCIAL